MPGLTLEKLRRTAGMRNLHIDPLTPPYSDSGVTYRFAVWARSPAGDVEELCQDEREALDVIRHWSD